MLRSETHEGSSKIAKTDKGDDSFIEANHDDDHVSGKKNKRFI